MASIIKVDTIQSTTSNVFFQNSSGTEYARFDSGGNLGIGTTTPGAKLDVRGSSTFLINAANPTAWVSSDSTLVTQSMYMQVNTTSSDTRLGSYTNHPLLFLTNNSERMRILSTGNILSLSGGSTTATGTGIAFPATQSASSDANTLDDYEEGTWTPFLQFSGTPSSGAVYSDQKGIYTKIGNMVYVQAYLSWTNKGTTTGVWQLGGLPFSTPSTGSTGGMANRASVGAIGNSYGTQKGTGLYGESSTTYFLPTYVNASGQLGELTQADVSSTGQIFYGGYYRVA